MNLHMLQLSNRTLRNERQIRDYSWAMQLGSHTKHSKKYFADFKCHNFASTRVMLEQDSSSFVPTEIIL